MTVRPDRIEIGEPHAAAVGRIVHALAVRVVHRVGQRRGLPSHADGARMPQAMAGRIEHDREILEAEVLRTEVTLRERKHVPVHVPPAQRIVHVVERIDAAAQIGFAELERHRIEADRRKKEVAAFASEVGEFHRHLPRELVRH